MADGDKSSIDISHINPGGIAGLGLVVMVAVVAYALPSLRWLALTCMAVGILGGLAVVVYRRRR